MIIKCKMCGGSLEVQEGATTCTCDYCGTQQTIPSARDEGIQTLFNRANVLRMKAEFDKAEEIYEKILQQNEEEAEAYWGLILCKYGIEYVEDPTTYKRVPTCHRASYDSVSADEDYKNAIRYADMTQKGIYESEAAEIDEIQKGILALAQKEDPYDVFICYKETGEDGKRTQDSVIANDIYHQLTEEGYKVFYAAITLEDKLGRDYEPCIFSALNTAKVMLAIGTKPEYFNAVWVKNEWSRFLKIMKKDRSRLLIPCYRDMDPYDLPEEFAHLQAQDMGKIGFINDLVRGIKKVIVKEQASNTETVLVQQGVANTTTSAQVKRGNMALEDHDWERADGFFEEALNIEPECAEAYIGKLLAQEKKSGFDSWVAAEKMKYNKGSEEVKKACEKDEDHISMMVKECSVDGYLSADKIRKEYEFDFGYQSELSDRLEQKEKQLRALSQNYLLNRARQFASGSLAEILERGISDITEQLNQRISIAQTQDEDNVSRVKRTYAEHLAIADQKMRQLREKALADKENDYQNAVESMHTADEIDAYIKVQKIFLSIRDYKDCEELAAECQNKIDEINAAKQRKADEQNEKRRQEEIKKKKRIKVIISCITAVIIICFAIVILTVNIFIPGKQYKNAMELKNSGDYENAIMAFEALKDFKDSAVQIEECKLAIKENIYEKAVTLIENGEYEAAKIELWRVYGYKESSALIVKCDTAIKDRDYENAIALKDAGEYEAAIAAFEKMNSYRDSEKLIAEILHTTKWMASCSVGETVFFGSYEQDNNTSNGKEDIEWKILAKENNRILVISLYALESKPYNKTDQSITWENCTLRKWLNETFINKAFTDQERAMIPCVVVSASKNPKYDTDPGNDTMDQVFLLSVTEVKKYMSSDKSCVPTDYCIAQGVFVRKSGTTAWWLRSPGELSSTVAYAETGGVTDMLSSHETFAVRPCIWIDLDK